MSITQEQLQFIINSDVELMASYLQSDCGLTVSEALGRIYNSRIYRKLIDTDTGLYLQSADYLYDLLMEEIEGVRGRANA